MSSGIEVGSIKMKIYNWVFTLTFSRIFEQNGANHWCYANDRQHATTGTRRHAPHFSQKARAFPSLFLFLASPLPTLPLLPFLILMLYLSHFLFSFFSFSLAYPPVLFIHPSFFHFVRWILFNQNLQFLFVIPTICISFSFTIFICQMIFQSILKIFHRVINVYYSD